MLATLTRRLARKARYDSFRTAFGAAGSGASPAKTDEEPKKIVAVLYRAGEAAKNPKLLGTPS
jgi:hypothetical protein